MSNNKIIKCPICGSEKAENLLVLNCGNLDHSTLYPSVKINSCEECGHIYNRLSSEDISGLMEYYNEEYAKINISSADKTGDRPGSNNKNTTDRYNHLYNLISKYITDDFKVLDVGCAMGGFLDYLDSKGVKNLAGIDPIVKYVDYAKHKNNHNIKVGSAQAIPFDDKTFNLVVMDQVMEHLADPIQAFKEAKRVLVDGGLICLGVPDASRYNKIYFFDFFWFLMREHIQHFDIEHLKLLASIEGFELLAHSESEIPITSESMILPDLNVVFRLTDAKNKLDITKNCFKLKKEIKQYIEDDFKRLNKKIKIFDALALSKKSLYAWGIGREFLYLYESAGLKKCNITALIDSNLYKQGERSVGGRKITDSTVLKNAPENSVLLISAIAHAESIKKIALSTGYNQQILDISQ
ncbi:MAG: class I SAM-dependent methyltransferase [Candidatus Staskawiczbacteria bacterium]|nr:class I SAM-dependent methyltransferase [Candidatus Staskawiczbacteria bacterium]